MSADSEAAKNPSAGDTAPPQDGRRGHRFVFWILFALVLALYAAFLALHFAPAISEPDANGYWAQGSLLFTTGRTWFEPESDSQYIGIHWLIAPSGRYFSRYPPGLPALIGLVYWTLGYKASVFVNPALALLSLIGFFLLLRRLLADGWALAGVLVLATNPIFSRNALACNSHMAVTFCLIWGLYFLLRWSANGWLWEVFTAGLFLGAIPTIRYPEALFGLGVGAFLLWHWRLRPHIWLHCVVAALGAAIPLSPLLIRNQLAFGAFWRTGYALTNEQTGFAWDYFRQHFVSYVRQISGEGVGPVLVLGLIGITVLCGVRRWRPLGVLLALLTVPSLLLYTFYYWGPQGTTGATATMRFLLPTFACYILAALWFLSQVLRPVSLGVRHSVVAVVLVLQIIWGGFSSFSEARTLHRQKVVLALITNALEKNTQHGDVVMAHQQILQHLDFVRHWRLADVPMAAGRPLPDLFRGREPDPNAPSPMQAEKREIQAEKYKDLTPRERERKVAEDIRAWAGEHKVYFVGTQREIDGMRGELFGPRSFAVLARIPLPEPRTPSPQDGAMGGPGPGPGAALGPPGGGPPRPFGPGPGFPPPGGAAPGVPPRFGGPGGPAGMGYLSGDKEIVIAQWTPPAAEEKKTR